MDARLTAFQSRVSTDCDIYSTITAMSPSRYADLHAQYSGNPYHIFLHIQRESGVTVNNSRIEAFFLLRGVHVTNLPKGLDAAEFVNKLEEKESSAIIGVPYERSSPMTHDDVSLVITNELVRKRRREQLMSFAGAIESYTPSVVADQVRKDVANFHKDAREKEVVSTANSLYYSDLLQNLFDKKKESVAVVKTAIAKTEYNIQAMLKPKDLTAQFKQETISAMFSDLRYAGHEVEIRFKFKGSEFGNLFDHFCVSNPEKYLFNNYTSRTISDRRGNVVTRRTMYDENAQIRRPHVQQKITMRSLYTPEWQIRTAISQEVTLHPETHVVNQRIVRCKNVFRIYSVGRDSPFRNFEVSLAIVTEEKDGNIDPKPQYEVELERKGIYLKFFTPAVIHRAIKTIFSIAQDTSFPISPSYQNDLLQLLSRCRSTNVVPFKADKKSVLDFTSTTHYVTRKLDGEHHRVVIHPATGIFLITNDNCVKIISDPFKLRNDDDVAPVILDAEVVYTDDAKLVVYVYDIILDVANSQMLPFTNRLETLKTWVRLLQNTVTGNVQFRLKGFQLINSTDMLSKSIDGANNDETADGIIIQPNSAYARSHPLKFKPKYCNSIDVFVTPYTTHSESHGRRDPVMGPILENLNVQYFMSTFHQKFNLSNFILELYYHPGTGKYLPQRFRFGKTTGNSKATIDSNLTLLRTAPLGKSYFTGRGIPVARKLTNELKRRLLGTCSGKLIDIGSGQGGDFDKWGRFDRVLVIERDAAMLKEFARRHDTRSGYDRVTFITDSMEHAPINPTFLDASLMTIFFSVNTVFAPNNVERFMSRLAKYRPATILVLYMESSLMAKAHDGTNIIVEDKGDAFLTTIPNTHVVNVKDYKFSGDAFMREAAHHLRGYDMAKIDPFKTDAKLNDDNMTGLMGGIYFESMSRSDASWLRAVRLIELRRRDVVEDEEDEEELLDELKAAVPTEDVPDETEDIAVVDYDEEPLVEDDDDDPHASDEDVFVPTKDTLDPEFAQDYRWSSEDEEYEEDDGMKKTTQQPHISPASVRQPDDANIVVRVLSDDELTELDTLAENDRMAFTFMSPEFWTLAFVFTIRPKLAEMPIYSDLPSDTFYAQNFIKSELKFGKNGRSWESVLRNGPPSDVVPNSLFVGVRVPQQHNTGQWLFIPPGGAITDADFSTLSSFQSVIPIYSAKYPCPSFLCSNRMFPDEGREQKLREDVEKINSNNVAFQSQTFYKMLGRFPHPYTIPIIIKKTTIVTAMLDAILYHSNFNRTLPLIDDAAQFTTTKLTAKEAYIDFCLKKNIAAQLIHIAGSLDRALPVPTSPYYVVVNDNVPVKERIQRFKTAGDGSCLFNAVLKSLIKAGFKEYNESSRAVRELRSQTLETARLLIDEGQIAAVSRQQALEELKELQRGQWTTTQSVLDNMMVAFLALTLNRTILVINKTASGTIVMRVAGVGTVSVDDKVPPILVWLQNEHYEGVSTTLPLAEYANFLSGPANNTPLENMPCAIQTHTPDGYTLEGVICADVSKMQRPPYAFYRSMDSWFRVREANSQLFVDRIERGKYKSRRARIPELLFYVKKQ